MGTLKLNETGGNYIIPMVYGWECAEVQFVLCEMKKFGLGLQGRNSHVNISREIHSMFLRFWAETHTSKLVANMSFSIHVILDAPIEHMLR